MRIWIAKNDKKAIDWYSFKGDFIPLKVFFSDEGGELMTVPLTDIDRFRLTKMARIPELRVHYPEIVEKSAAKWGTLYKAFRAQIYGSYLVVTHEDFVKGTQNGQRNDLTTLSTKKIDQNCSIHWKILTSF